MASTPPPQHDRQGSEQLATSLDEEVRRRQKAEEDLQKTRKNLENALRDLKKMTTQRDDLEQQLRHLQKAIPSVDSLLPEENLNDDHSASEDTTLNAHRDTAEVMPILTDDEHGNVRRPGQTPSERTTKRNRPSTISALASQKYSPFTDVKPEVKVKVDTIDVKIKNEEGEDVFTQVTLMKSEDGKLDIWNVDAFNLGPPLPLHRRYNRGFSRKVISDALGGGHMSCFHHFNRKKHPDKTPYVTFNRSWNPALPSAPGEHGIVLVNLTQGSEDEGPATPLPVIVGEGTNDWRYVGVYNRTRCGEILPAQVELIPEFAVRNWIDGILNTEWGKNWVADENEARHEEALEQGAEAEFREIERTEEGIRAALHDGRLTLGFTVLQCVGYNKDWFTEFLHYEKHPKPPQSRMQAGKSKRSAKKQGGRKSPKKAKKASVRHSETESGDNSEDGGEDEEDYVRSMVNREPSIEV
ncbi:hypothetical protein HGRIS_002095 [Hohenbuehelia grisea]|uniref:DUF6697 domain-containing protein n=1 Tax=Hohenbuehelia grisea TaxID=104357 RepID=A0ABR3JJW0_9AGAR